MNPTCVLCHKEVSTFAVIDYIDAFGWCSMECWRLHVSHKLEAAKQTQTAYRHRDDVGPGSAVTIDPTLLQYGVR